MAVDKRVRKRAPKGAPEPQYKTWGKGKYRYHGWVTRVTTGYDEDGKQKQKRVVGKTKAECQRLATELQAKVDSGEYKREQEEKKQQEAGKKKTYTLEEWLDVWLNEYCEGCKERTRIDYAAIIKNHINPVLGKIPIDQLDSDDIQKLINRITNQATGKPASAKTKRNVSSILHKSLAKAKAKKIITANPASTDIIELPTSKPKKYKPAEAETIAALVNYLNEHETKYRRILLVILALGLREGEAIGLSWDRVNLKDKTVNVDMQVQVNRKTWKPEFRSTKEDNEEYVSLPDFVVKIFEDEKKEQDANKAAVKAAGKKWANDWNLIFTHEDGRPFCAVTLYKHLKKAVAAVGIPEFRVHDLRHQAATNWLEAGVDIDTVSKNLRHADAGFTLKTYAQPTKKAMRDSAAAMDGYFANLKKAQPETA